MSVFDSLKNLMRNPEEEENEAVDAFETEVAPSRKKAEVSEPEPKGRNRVVNIHATTQLQVVLVKPERFDDASTIADHLLT